MSRRPPPQHDSPLAASPDSTPDGQYAYDLELARLITGLLGQHATWAAIGRALGGISGREAKRRYHHLARKTGRTWRLQDNAALGSTRSSRQEGS